MTSVTSLSHHIKKKTAIFCSHHDSCQIIYIIILCVSFCSDIWFCNILAYYLDNQTLSIIMILMWSCPGNMPKYYLDKTTLLYKYRVYKSSIITSLVFSKSIRECSYCTVNHIKFKVKDYCSKISVSHIFSLFFFSKKSNLHIKIQKTATQK